MANARVCDVCGMVENFKSRPPNVQQFEIKGAAETFDVILCSDCKVDKPLGEILAASKGRPGGTVEGADQLAYLIRR